VFFIFSINEKKDLCKVYYSSFFKNLLAHYAQGFGGSISDLVSELALDKGRSNESIL
jgi:hypothetical protein